MIRFTKIASEASLDSVYEEARKMAISRQKGTVLTLLTIKLKNGETSYYSKTSYRITNSTYLELARILYENRNKVEGAIITSWYIEGLDHMKLLKDCKLSIAGGNEE